MFDRCSFKKPHDVQAIVIKRMQFIMNDAFKGATGKLCGHSDMGATYISRTGKTYSHKLCNKRNLEELPYSAKEISHQGEFKKRAAVVSATVKSLTNEQRKALKLLRNERGLYCIRQLIEGIYNKESQTVPADKLAELIEQSKRTSSSNAGSNPSHGSNGNTNTDGDL